MNEYVVVILAGGKGKRMSQVTGERLPKQFFAFQNGETLFYQTFKRALQLTDMVHIMAVLPQMYLPYAKKTCPELPDENYIIEPIQRNTAACMALACNYVLSAFGDIPIAFLPADHYIPDIRVFAACADEALRSACENHIVLVGLTPQRAETGYGYIHVKNNAVVGFYEKPDAQTAQKFVESAEYLWNSGMYFVKPQVLLDEIKIYFDEALSDVCDYARIPSVSIDKAVTQKTKKLCVVKGNFIWDDVGSLQALERLLPSDGNQNRILGNIKLKNCFNCTVISGESSDFTVENKRNCFIVVNENGLHCYGKDDVF